LKTSLKVAAEKTSGFHRSRHGRRPKLWKKQER